MNPVRKDVRIQMETCEFLNICTERRSAMHEQRRTMVEEARILTWYPAGKGQYHMI